MRLVLAAAFFAMAACSRAGEDPADTAIPAMAPAPSATPITDTGMKMDTSTKTPTTKATKATTKRP
jgi:hypothetical protein